MASSTDFSPAETRVPTSLERPMSPKISVEGISFVFVEIGLYDLSDAPPPHPDLGRQQDSGLCLNCRQVPELSEGLEHL